MARTATAKAALPDWIRPQLTQLVKEAPDGDQWLHEIKYDGFRMHARLDHGEVRLLTRNGLNWTAKYPQIAAAVAALARAPGLSRRRIVRRARRRHHLVQHDPAGVRRRQRRRPRVLPVRSSLSRGRGSHRPALIERKERLAGLLPSTGSPLHYSDHQIGLGPGLLRACLRRESRRDRLETRRCAAMHPAIAACGSRSNASTARNLS